MRVLRRAAFIIALGLAGASAPAALANDAAASAPSVPQALFAVEFRTGPAWDPAKPPPEQARFREHSANLKKLRDEGRLLVGARYADKGLIVLAAESREQARAWIDADPAVQAQVFVYELHDFRVFYPGSLGAPRR